MKELPSKQQTHSKVCLELADDLQQALAAGIYVWAENVFGEGGWEAVGVAEFHRPKYDANCICRLGALVDGENLEIGDEVEDTLTSAAPFGNLTELFLHRNDIPNNNWWNYKMIVWSDGRVQTFFSYEVLDGDDPRLWSDESEFTFGPFEQKPVLRH